MLSVKCKPWIYCIKYFLEESFTCQPHTLIFVQDILITLKLELVTLEKQARARYVIPVNISHHVPRSLHLLWPNEMVGWFYDRASAEKKKRFLFLIFFLLNGVRFSKDITIKYFQNPLPGPALKYILCGKM